jgi:multidrug resistance efflux pump
MLSSLIRYGLPAVALAGLVFAVAYVTRNARRDEAPPAKSQAIQPPTTPYEDTLAGAGVVEAQSENISIGSPTPGIVAEVPVEVGQKVEQGKLLFRMDDRELRGELLTLQAAVEVAEAELLRLQSLPRAEDVAADAAALEEAEAVEVEARQQLDRILQLVASRAVTQADVDEARRAVAVAAAQVAKVGAELDLTKAGAWQYDVMIAKQKAEQARAAVARVQTELDRLEVRAPRQGEVLQIDVRPGEFAGTPPDRRLMMLGSTDSLHVRVDIDEQDIGRYRAGIPGVAMPRGFPDLKYQLRFKRIEPFVVPKRSLTGDNTERVDTRVLQVIYEVVKNEPPLYVGQQVDVFFKLPPRAGSSPTPASGRSVGAD